MAANNSLTNNISNINVEHNLNLPSRVFYEISDITFQKLNENDIIYFNLSFSKINEIQTSIHNYGTANVIYDYTNRGHRVPVYVNGRVNAGNNNNYGGAGNNNIPISFFEYILKHMKDGKPMFMGKILKKRYLHTYLNLVKILKVNTDTYPDLTSLVGHNIPIYPKHRHINIYKINQSYLKNSIKKSKRRIIQGKSEKRMANSIARQKPGQRSVISPLIKSFIPENNNNMKQYMKKKYETRRNKNATNGGKKRKTYKKRRR